MPTLGNICALTSSGITYCRGCTGLHPCLEISRKPLPLGETLKLMQRNYVNPGSIDGPDPTKLLNPYTIILDGRARPVSHQEEGDGTQDRRRQR